MDVESSQPTKGSAEQGIRALHEYLSDYFFRHRIPWMHDLLGNDFNRGEAYAITGLVLIPEVRAALDKIDKQVGRDLARWHDAFKPKESE